MVQAVYDQELANAGKCRIHVPETIQVGNKLATVVREKVVNLRDVKPNPVKPWYKVRKKGKARMSTDVITSDVSKAPRSGSKLSQAVDIVKSTGKDDKESCLQAIIGALGVKRGNASIYYAKAKSILG